MISTSDAKKILEELEREHSLLTLDSLTIQSGETTLVGRGTLQRKKGRFSLSARFDLGSVPSAFAQAHFDGMQKPRIYSRDDFWTMEAKTSGGVSFECKVGPPHGWTDRSDGVTEIRCHIDKLTLKGETDIDFLINLYNALDEKEITEGKEIEVPLDSLNKCPSKFHAILPGVKCVLAEHRTRIERHNVFFPVTSSEKLDTYVDVNPDRSIGLIEEGGDLHVFLELPPSDSSEETENAVFSALLDAVAFTHGCQPFTRLREYRRAGRVVCCEIAPVTDLEIATIKPICDSTVHMGTNTRAMLGVAFEYFKGDKAIVTRIHKAMWLYREAASKAVPLPIQVLTACTLFEGLVKNLFDTYGLKGPMKIGEASKNFATNKEAAKGLLMEKHHEAMIDAGVESDWSRMAGYLNNSHFVRHREQLKAVAEHFGFQWENDVELIHKIWSRHRNPLAHGEGLKSDYTSISELFQCWSRLSGSIHRFILAEMGYVGSFIYSPMEPGLVEMDLKAKPENSTPQTHSAKECLTSSQVNSRPVPPDKPMILYKYLTVEKADEWLIGENSILLTPPIYLNDLLEFRVRREPADLVERRAMFELFQKEKPSALTFEEYDRSVMRKEYLDREPEDLRNLFSENMGVISLTSDPANELMWAHYGLNSGVAIGYLSDDIGESEVFRCSFMPLGDAIEVTYNNLVTPMKKDFSDAVTQLTKKRECWRYENEWRIVKKLEEARSVIRGDKTYYCLPAKREQISHVVFGANADADFIERIDVWLKNSPALRQKLRIDPDTHDLVLSDIEKP